MTESSSSEFSNFASRLREFIGVSRAHSDQAPQSSDAEFNRLALDLFTLQYAHNNPYRRLCAAWKVRPENLRHWSEIPSAPASAFKEFELTCLPPEQRTSVFHSSGTTKQSRSRHFHSAESLAIYEASLLNWFAIHVPIFGSRHLILTPTPAQAPNSSLVHMFETVGRESGTASSMFTGYADAEGVWHVDLEKTAAVLNEAIAARRRVLLLGTAFTFVHLLDHLSESGIPFSLPPGSGAMETGGYKGRSRSLSGGELHALISRRLGLPAENIIREYGMSELSSQAYDHVLGKSGGDPRRFRFPPWARAQVISPETGREVAEGETGLIRIVDLANVYSCLAVQTEDLGIRRGRGFELLGRAVAAEARGCSLQSL